MTEATRFPCRWDGRALWVPRGATLDTDRCLICGSPDDVRPWRKKCFYTQVWGRGALPILTTDELLFSRCDPCRDWMRLNTATVIMATSVVMLGVPNLVDSLASVQNTPWILTAANLSAFAALMAAWHLWAPRHFVLCTGITPSETRLSFPSPETTRAVIEERPL